MGERITAGRVRYIKLGRGGVWEDDCLSHGTIRLGFGTGKHFELCNTKGWDRLASTYANEGRSPGKVTENVNQVRSFFEDDGSILWITFSRRLMWWAKVNQLASVQPHPTGEGTFRPVAVGWKCTDQNGSDLHMDSLSGAVTQLASYRGTSCDVRDEDYVIRRVNGEKLQIVKEAEELSRQVCVATIGMMQLLTPKDFELLVDLVFAESGWRRLGVLGKTEKTVDMEIELPSTGERAFVQIKSRTSQKEFDDQYVDVFHSMHQVGRMFYVHHSGAVSSNDANITVIGPERLATMVSDAGLTSWLMRRVS